METRDITQLLTAAGITAELVFEGPPSGCPHCAAYPDHCLAEAA